MYEIRLVVNSAINTEDPRYNDSVCCQRFCVKIYFAVIEKLDKDPSKV